LGGDAGTDTSAALRATVQEVLGAMPSVPGKGTSHGLPVPPAPGFARQDAFGVILNEVVGTALGEPGNRGVADAPVSFPFLWRTPDLAWVQWNGLAANPIWRNIGEVLGVFGHVSLEANFDRFRSTARIDKLFELEEWIRDLKPPAWPEAQLGAIDQEKAARGQEIYEAACKSCHSLPNADGQYPLTSAADNLFGERFIEVKMIPLAAVGTDPRVIQNLLPRVVATGKLADVLNKEQAPAVEILVTVTAAIFERYAQEQGLSDEEKRAFINSRLDRNGDPERQTPENMQGYKARPLDGIWATAPYLHNGSVPTLYHLLLPPAERPSIFFVGSRQFDPRQVGFESIESAGAYRFDTSIDGNRNIGHDYGTTLEDEQRWELVEFLKTL
ncbi:MAG: cytochrome c, partial [Holophagales bacterium]|nr:cytochrome c [Holophagales bacterium]